MMSASRLLGAMRAVATIPPPARSFEDWERFLEACREAGMTGYDDARREFATPLGEALLKRWRWLRDARARGLDFETASDEFDRSVDVARAEAQSRMSEAEKVRARHTLEATDARRQRRNNRNRTINDRDREPDWSDQMHTFAEEAGLT